MVHNVAVDRRSWVGVYGVFPGLVPVQEGVMRRLALILRLWLPSVRIAPGQSWAEARRCADLVERTVAR